MVCRQQAVALSSFGSLGTFVFLTLQGAQAGREMHYKLKCSGSRGETFCDSSPVPPSKRSSLNTKYCILHTPSPPCAVCANVLLFPTQPQQPGMRTGAACCSSRCPAGWAPTVASLALKAAGNTGQGFGGQHGSGIKLLLTLSIPVISWPTLEWDLPLSEVGKELGEDGEA